MDYNAKLINNATIEELEAEKQKMYDDQYRYGYMVDKSRIWDINYTISQLSNNRLDYASIKRF